MNTNIMCLLVLVKFIYFNINESEIEVNGQYKAIYETKNN